MEQQLKRMFEMKETEMTVPPTLSPELRNRIGRQRMVMGGLVAAAAFALVLGGFAVRSAVSTDAAPVRPAEEPLEPRQGVEIITGAAVVDPATGRSRALVDGAKIQGEIGNAAWSYAGRWVAYDINGRKDSLWVVGPQGEPRQLAEVAGAWAWSPTDTQLAMMRTPSIFPDTAEGRVPLTLFDASTGRQTDLGMTVGEVTTGPVWSPDGTRIAYGVRGGSIYSVDVEGGDHTLLVGLQGDLDSIFGLEWSPDGAHIAILADAVEDLRRLYVMNADASELPVLVDDLEASGWGSFPGDPLTQIAWSPDGTRLTYATFSGPDQRELRIWTASVDGSGPSLVASHINDECCIDGGSPVWSPDGSHIAFETDREARQERHLAVNADGTGEPSEIDWLTYLSWRGGWYFCYCYG
jgi:Tol biopolymer transport system component